MRSVVINKSLLATSAILGCAGMIYFLRTRNIENLQFPEALYPCCFVAVVTAFFSLAMPRQPSKIALAVVAGIAGGVGINAYIDELLFDKGHNLFPLEMMMWAILVAPGALAGTATGRLICYLRRKM